MASTDACRGTEVTDQERTRSKVWVDRRVPGTTTVNWNSGAGPSRRTWARRPDPSDFNGFYGTIAVKSMSLAGVPFSNVSTRNTNGVSLQ